MTLELKFYKMKDFVMRINAGKSTALMQNALRAILFFFCIIAADQIQAQSTKTITPGAKIINMGVTPQTIANGLKPYGLVYNLIQTQKIPVIWSISPTKAKDSADFTVDGIKFKGGTFVIESDYAKQANVIAAINTFTALGVNVYTTLTTVTIPVYKELKVFPRWTLDLASGSIVDSYLINANIPTTNFPLRDPSTLGVCDDIFLLPHADPTWTTHKNLYFWNKPVSQGGNMGWLWSSCHAVSELERSANAVAPFEKMNFLSQSPPVPPLVAYGSHANASAGLFSYAYPKDVPMQFMGRLDAATRNGSEQVYLPTRAGGGAWSPTTKICVWDPAQSNIPTLSLGPAAIVVYGPAFGDTANGMIMYEAGHNHDGTAPENIAAMRAMLNFSFDAPAKKAPSFTIVNPVPTSVFFRNNI